MTELEKQPHLSCRDVELFMERVVIGVNQALSFPGPVLIVAHGGVHFALCHHMDIQEHTKTIDHCVPVHFYPPIPLRGMLRSWARRLHEVVAGFAFFLGKL